MSTDDSGDFFAQIAHVKTEVPDMVPRDQWGRPLIVDPTTGEATAYTRASTMAGYIDNAYGLHQWQLRLVAQGMGHRSDLAAMAAALPPYDSCTKAHKAELKEIVEAALETAGAYQKANHGSAIHAFTDPSHVSGPVPSELAADVASHEAVMEATGIVYLVNEVFVVNDELKVAGTLDYIAGVPALDALLVGDKKTGKADLHKTAIQVALYQGGQAYDHETGERTPLRDYVADKVGMDVPEISNDVGLYTHIPRLEGKTTLHPLNLADGRRMAAICAQVREWNASQGFVGPDTAEWLTNQRHMPALKAITEAGDLQALKSVVARYKWCWDDRLNKAGEARWAELGRPTE